MKKKTLLVLVLTGMLLVGVNGYSMHIMEGFLPLNWVLVWFAVCIPFWIIGIKKLQSVSKGSVQDKMTLALAGAFIFVLSALKIPSVTGSSSHPTGVGLSAILLAAAIGDLATYVVTSFQLAFAYPSPEGGVIASFIKFGTVFAVTQIPLAVIEGLLTNVVMNILEKYNVKGVEA